MKVVGHRGCAGLRPENTLAAFRHAVSLGVDALECDVHLTRDERLVIMHDDRVDRTTNGTGPIAGLTCAEVRQLDAGAGERVPLLEEVLDVVAASAVGLLLELKGDGTPEPAVAAVQARGLGERVVFTGFDFSRIEQVRRLWPAAQTGAIFPRADAGSPEIAKAVGASGMGIQFRALTAELVRRAHTLGLEVRGWNPDTVEDQRATIAHGPDGISTNRPDRLLALLGRGSAPV